MSNTIYRYKRALLITLSISVFSCTSTENKQVISIEKVDDDKKEQSSPSPQITITWQDNADNEKGYIVQRRLTSSRLYGKTKVLPKNSNSYTDSNVLDGRAYCYLVSAYNQQGRSSSDEICIDLSL